MDAYRTSPEATPLIAPPSPRPWRTPLVIGLSAAAHVLVLGASAWMQPAPPPAPLHVQVLRWEATTASNGELTWRNAGYEEALVRADPAGHR
jgi:hypothetical protein